MAQVALRKNVTSVALSTGPKGLQSQQTHTVEMVPFREEIYSREQLSTPEGVAGALHAIQRHVAESTQAPRSLPFLGGVYFPNVTMAAGANAAFAHGVAGLVSFAAFRPRILATGAAPQIVEVGQDANGRITLSATVACIVDLYFFPQPGPGGTALGATPPFPVPSPPVTWGADLLGSTNIAQWVAAISGSGGLGGAVTVKAQNFVWSTTDAYLDAPAVHFRTRAGAEYWSSTLTGGVTTWASPSNSIAVTTGGNIRLTTAGTLALGTATAMCNVNASGVQLGSETFSLGGGAGVVGFADRTTAPTSNPTAGAILYSESGALWIRESGGANFKIAAAGGAPTWTNHAVVLGTGSSALGSVGPGTLGIPLIGQGAAADPIFGTAKVAGGGTGATSFTAHGVLVGEGTSPVVSVASATANTLLQSGGSSDPVWSTWTMVPPSTAGKVLRSDGTNYVNSAWTVAAPGTSGNLLTSDGTNWTSAPLAGVDVANGYARATGVSVPGPGITTIATVSLATTQANQRVQIFCSGSYAALASTKKMTFGIGIDSTTATVTRDVFTSSADILGFAINYQTTIASAGAHTFNLVGTSTNSPGVATSVDGDIMVNAYT